VGRYPHHIATSVPQPNHTTWRAWAGRGRANARIGQTSKLSDFVEQFQFAGANVPEKVEGFSFNIRARIPASQTRPLKSLNFFNLAGLLHSELSAKKS
jgi:hypothetical protein